MKKLDKEQAVEFVARVQKHLNAFKQYRLGQAMSNMLILFDMEICNQINSTEKFNNADCYYTNIKINNFIDFVFEEDAQELVRNFYKKFL